jgi:3'(2'), 5'-bisphosphate nucleotidase
MPYHSFSTEYEVARRLAREAGRGIVRNRDGGGQTSPEVAVRAAAALVIEGLRREFPKDAVLAEPTVEHEDRLRNDRVWMVDCADEETLIPADTRETSIVIGLTVARMPVIGVIHLPSRQISYGAAWGAGAWVEEGGATRPLKARPPDNRGFRMISPRPGPEPLLSAIRQELSLRESRECGSTSYACAMIADGAADLYVHPTPLLKDWHCCAPDLLLREAGGTVTDCYGEPLSYNRRGAVQRQGFIGCAPGVLDAVLVSVTPRFAAEYAPPVLRPRVNPDETMRLTDIRVPRLSA